MTPSTYPPRFTSAHPRARIVKILLIVGVFAAAMSLLADVFSFALPPLSEDQEFGDNPAGGALMLITFGLALFEAIVYVTTAVFFLMWLYRSYGNLRAIDASCPLSQSPGWVVGSFFIPFVNLVIPYRGVKELWQRSGSPEESVLSAPSPPAIFPIWWLFWLLSCFADNISFRASFDDRVMENAATTLSIVAGALSILAAVFAYFVVDAIDKRQEETSAKLNLGVFAGPPPAPVFQ